MSRERAINATDMFCKEFRNQNLIKSIAQIYFVLRKHSLGINMLHDLGNNHTIWNLVTTWQMLTVRNLIRKLINKITQEDN